MWLSTWQRARDGEGGRQLRVGEVHLEKRHGLGEEVLRHRDGVDVFALDAHVALELESEVTLSVFAVALGGGFVVRCEADSARD